jgi:hypothetical protein
LEAKRVTAEDGGKDNCEAEHKSVSVLEHLQPMT